MSLLTIRQSGEVTLDGVITNPSVTRTVDVSHVFQNTLTISTGATLREVVNTSKTGDGFGDIQFFAITNLDTTNFINITIADDGATTDGFAHIKLPAGKTFVLGSKGFYTDLTVPASFANIATVSLDADTAACQAKIFWAV